MFLLIEWSMENVNAAHRPSDVTRLRWSSGCGAYGDETPLQYFSIDSLSSRRALPT